MKYRSAAKKAVRAHERGDEEEAAVQMIKSERACEDMEDMEQRYLDKLLVWLEATRAAMDDPATKFEAELEFTVFDQMEKARDARRRKK